MRHLWLLLLAALLCAHCLAYMPVKRVSALHKPQGSRSRALLFASPAPLVKDAPTGTQRLAVGAISGGLLVSSVAIVKAIEAAERAFPSAVGSWIGTFPVLGFIFALAGVLHFTIKDEFANIYPDQGAWGLWFLPGSADFWVLLSGVFEIIGGSGMAFGLVNSLDAVRRITGIDSSHLFYGSCVSDSALFMLAVVIGVTPANIFMYTHGKRLPRDGPEVPANFHAVRGALQAVLFAQLYLLAKPTLAALGL